MQVKISKKSDLIDCECRVIQANTMPSPVSESTAKPDWIESKTIAVIVPTRMSSVVCQVDHDARMLLEACYANCMIAASSLGFKSVTFPQLGVQDLYWDPVQSAAAARVAMTEVFDNIDEDFKVVFEIEDEDFEIWDGVMDF